MPTFDWQDTEFVKAKPEDPLLRKLSAATASFLVNKGLPREANGYFFTFNDGLRPLQKALLHSAASGHIRKHIRILYVKHPVRGNYINIGWHGVAGCLCINPDRNDEVVWLTYLGGERTPMLINSSVERFFVSLGILNEMYVEMHFDDDTGFDGEAYDRHNLEMTQAMRKAIIAAEVPGFDFDRSKWAKTMEAILYDQY